MLMRYLNNNERPGVIEYLVNKLYSETYQDVDLYLPQICFLILTKKNEECVQVLQKFILEISMRDLNIGMRALHLFQAWSEDDKAVYYERALSFYEMIEGTLVNLKLPRTFQDQIGGLLYQ